MSNSYSDMTGVLVLNKVTPVIQALFGCFDLDATTPGNGQAYIADIAESTSCSWGSLQGDLQLFAHNLGLEIDESEPLGNIVLLLAEHFRVSDHKDLPDLVDHLNNRIEECDGAELEILFIIARILDDGHGLVACKTERSWHCDQPKLFEFGGHGSFLGVHVCYDGGSQQAVNFGQSLETALADQAYEAAGTLVFNQVKAVLDGFSDVQARQKVLFELIGLLSEESSSPSA